MKIDIIIIGAGIVGLATALTLKERRPGLKVLVLDKEDRLAMHQTGHNSGVIHSGLYYKPGSMKARNCISGYHDLISFCRREEIPFEICGKVVVATSQEEVPRLEVLWERGNENGLKNLKKLSAAELAEYEPHVHGVAAIHVPQTGIVDYTRVSEAYAAVFQRLGGQIELGKEVTDIQPGTGDTTVVTDHSTFTCKLVVNCAGLYSDKVAAFTHQSMPYRIIPFRGEYYTLAPARQSLVNNLIYPVPDPNFPFLGVHFTRMLNGGIEAGPNAVLAFRREGYRRTDVNMAELSETLRWPGFRKVAGKYWRTGMGEMYRSFSKKAFTTALQKLMPEIRAEDLIPGGAGVRAQACDREGNLLDDFLILENDYAVNVCNAPSPAATSSLAIGQTVSAKVLKHFD